MNGPPVRIWIRTGGGQGCIPDTVFIGSYLGCHIVIAGYLDSILCQTSFKVHSLFECLSGSA